MNRTVGSKQSRTSIADIAVKEVDAAAHGRERGISRPRDNIHTHIHTYTHTHTYMHTHTFQMKPASSLGFLVLTSNGKSKRRCLLSVYFYIYCPLHVYIEIRR